MNLSNLVLKVDKTVHDRIMFAASLFHELTEDGKNERRNSSDVQ